MKKFFESLWQWLKNIAKIIWLWLEGRIYNMFCRNHWGWLHLVISAVLCSIYFRLFGHTWSFAALKMEASIVFGIAFILEFCEYVIDFVMTSRKVKDEFGTIGYFIEHSVGNILFAVIGWLIALI